MTQNEMERFEAFLSDSFKEGIIYRELRLSSEEIQYTKQKYPRASFKEILNSACSEEKAWFEVKLI